MPKQEQGVNKKRYQVIPRILIFITNSNKILLIKGHPNKRIWANKYNGIGGHVEYGEDILSAAKRELFEETGLEGIDLFCCGNIMVDASDDVGISIFLFRGEYLTGEIVESEEGRCEWVLINQMDALPLVEDLYRIIPKVLEFRPGNHPIIGHTYYDSDDQMIIEFR